MSTESAGEQQEGGLEHQRKALDEGVEWPSLEPVAFALPVAAALDYRATRIAQVSVQPLLPQHGNECGEQGDHKTCIHEAGDSDDLARRIFLNRWNGGGLTRDGGLIESEEDSAEEGSGLLVGIGLEVRMDIDDKRGADGREQTRLGRTNEILDKRNYK